MSAFLWTMVALAVGEFGGTAYYALIGRVPERTAGQMAFNTVLVIGLGIWSFWLLMRGAS